MLGFRSPLALTAAIDAAAEADPTRPSRSEMIRIILQDWLTGRRFLPYREAAEHPSQEN